MLPSGSRSPPASDAAQNRFVRTAHWSITGKCNYRCRHCYMSAPDAKLGEIDHDTMMDLARQIADCGILEVSLTGGEPLVRRDFMELVDALLSYRIRIAQIYTNGKLVDEKLLDQLEERGIRPEFNMSYDGTQGWHDWMRGVPGAGDAVLAAFDLCHERGFPTGAEMCLHQGNKHLLRESVSTLAAHHCESLKVNPVADTDTWERLGEDRSLTLEETFEVYLDYIPCFYEDGAPLGLHLGGFFMGRPGSGDWTIPNIGKHPEERDPAETELDESELAAVSGGSVIVSPLFKCNYQQDNTLCCASCAYSRFSYPNLYCFLDKNEGGPKPAEVMPLQSNGNLQ